MPRPAPETLLHPLQDAAPEFDYPHPLFGKEIRHAQRIYGERGKTAREGSKTLYNGRPLIEMVQHVATLLHQWTAKRSREENPYEGDIEGFYDRPKYKLRHLVGSSFFAYVPHIMREEHEGLELDPHMPLQPANSHFAGASAFALTRSSQARGMTREAQETIHKSMLLDAYTNRYTQKMMEAERGVQQETLSPADLDTSMQEVEQTQKQIRRIHPAVRLFNAAKAYAELAHNSKHFPGRYRRILARIALKFHAPFLINHGLEKEGSELQNLAFRNLYRRQYNTIEKELQRVRPYIEQNKAIWESQARSFLARHGIEADVEFREKTHYSIFRKRRKKPKYAGASVLEMGDLFAGRITLKGKSATVKNCYRLKQLLQEANTGIFKTAEIDHTESDDYIKTAKKSGYQALHVILKLKDPAAPFRKTAMETIQSTLPLGISPDVVNSLFPQPLKKMELQIQTEKMRQNNNSGPAAHGVYKDIDTESEARPILERLGLHQPTIESDLPGLTEQEITVHVRDHKGKVERFDMPASTPLIDYLAAQESIRGTLGLHGIKAFVDVPGKKGKPLPLDKPVPHGTKVFVKINPGQTPNKKQIEQWLAVAQEEETRFHLQAILEAQRIALEKSKPAPEPKE